MWVGIVENTWNINESILLQNDLLDMSIPIINWVFFMITNTYIIKSYIINTWIELIHV